MSRNHITSRVHSQTGCHDVATLRSHRQPMTQTVEELDPHTTKLSELDRQLVSAVSGIKILSSVSWPVAVQQQWLNGWRKGERVLPEIVYPVRNLESERASLNRIYDHADPGHPMGAWIRAQCSAYMQATRLLEHLGRPQLTVYSEDLYGRPGDLLPGSTLSSVDAAHHFLEVASDLHDDLLATENEYCIEATTMQRELQADVDALFGIDRVSVVVDASLASKAAAGPTRIRLRGDTCFSEYDRRQLLEHEAFVHSLTGLNGRSQPHFPSLGLNSPRITATQEGLATFAELITGAIDLSRMKRLSLRILAIDMALNGADFLQVMDYFLEHGQDESESFNSTMRVFRGAPLAGGHAFTKDGVYLHGLLQVHTFFRLALKQGKLMPLRMLFAGKMTLDDVIALEPMFESGVLAPPHWLPPWLQRIRGLAGILAFSLFANRIPMDRVAADAATGEGVFGDQPAV